MIKADLHLHSNFSPDSNVECTSYIEKAINLGFHSICITDHYDLIYLYENIESCKIALLEPHDYLKYLNGLKERYIEKIDVLSGIEVGLTTHLQAPISKFLSNYKFDFVIGSSHFVGSIEPHEPRFWNSYSEKEAILNYFNSVLENIKNFDNYDVYGHLDYVVRYRPGKSKTFDFNDYSDLIYEILSTIIKNGKGIEINTSGLRNGLGYVHPHKSILKMYKSLGGEILTIGSDSHFLETIGYKFKVVKDLMTELGFQYYAVYKNRIPQFYKI